MQLVPFAAKRLRLTFQPQFFWCENCSVPLIKKSSPTEKETCPICGEKTKYLATDIRPVFSEEKLLLAALLDKDLQFFMNRSVWAAGSRYFVDGKSFLISAKKFAKADADFLAAKISAVNATYTDFNETIRIFVRANKFRLLALKDEAFSFVKDVAKNFAEENVIISFSGDKDSTVIADIATKALSNPNLVHVFGNTTLEFPSTLEYADRYRKNHPDAIFFCRREHRTKFFQGLRRHRVARSNDAPVLFHVQNGFHCRSPQQNLSESARIDFLRHKKKRIRRTQQIQSHRGQRGHDKNSSANRCGSDFLLEGHRRLVVHFRAGT